MSGTHRSPHVFRRPLRGAGPSPQPPHPGLSGFSPRWGFTRSQCALCSLFADFSPNKTCFVFTLVSSKGFFPTVGHKDNFLYYLLKLLQFSLPHVTLEFVMSISATGF